MQAEAVRIPTAGPRKAGASALAGCHPSAGLAGVAFATPPSRGAAGPAAGFRPAAGGREGGDAPALPYCYGIPGTRPRLAQPHRLDGRRCAVVRVRGSSGCARPAPAQAVACRRGGAGSMRSS